MKKTNSSFEPKQAAAVVSEKPKGNPPVMRGVVQINHIEKNADGTEMLTSEGKRVYKSEDVGEFALWVPTGDKLSEAQANNPFNPDYFGNITILGRTGKIGLFEKKGSQDPKYPVLTGEVYDAGRNIIGKVAFWNGKSANPKAPKYVGSMTVSETQFVYRLSMWTK